MRHTLRSTRLIAERDIREKEDLTHTCCCPPTDYGGSLRLGWFTPHEPRKSFEVIALLEFWVQVLAPVDRCQKIFQEPTCNVLAAADALKMLEQSFIQRRDDIVEEAINRATCWCEKEIPLQKRRRKRKRLPGESTHDEVLTATQAIRRMMLAVIDVLVSEMTTRGQRLFELHKKFAFLTSARSDGLGDVETKASVDLVRTYPNVLSAELIQELTDLTCLTPNLNHGSIGELLLSAIRYGPNSAKIVIMPNNIMTAAKNVLTTAVSVVSCERSFSKLKLIKTALRTSRCLSGLSCQSRASGPMRCKKTTS